ncbi:MAG: FtsX-like permease family protein [Gemmataceae bacterium]
MGWRRPSFAWRYATREVLRRPLRTLLTLVGIVLGVAAVAAVSLAEAATRENYVRLFRPVAGRAALEVVPAGGEGTIPPDLAAIETTPGVRSAAPVVFVPTALLTPAGPRPLYLLGIDPARDGRVRELTVLEGAGQGLMVEADYAARNGLTVGQPARLMTMRGPVEVVVTGLLAARGPARFNGGTLGVLPLKDAQALFGVPGEVSAVQLVLDPGAEPARVARALEEKLPGREVRSPLLRGRLGGEFLASTEQMMRSLSAVALVAGAMVIVNTFLMNLGERRRQLGLLRALGATRGQVTGLVARQALLLGVVGTLVGLPAGVALASVLVALEESFLGVPMPRLPIAPGPLLLAAAVGPAMTLLASLLPAGRAASRPPLAAITARGRGIDDPRAGRSASGWRCCSPLPPT